MTTATIEIKHHPRSILSEIQKHTKLLILLTVVIIVGVAAWSFMNSKSEQTSLQAMTNYYAAHKSLEDLTEKNKWTFEKLNVDESIATVLPLYRKVWEQNPDSKAAYLARGELAQFYVNHGEPEKSVPLLEGSIKASKSGSIDQLGAEYALATVYEVLGKCAEAKSHYQKSFNASISTFKALAQEGLVRCVK